MRSRRRRNGITVNIDRYNKEPFKRNPVLDRQSLA